MLIKIVNISMPLIKASKRQRVIKSVRYERTIYNIIFNLRKGAKSRKGKRKWM